MKYLQELQDNGLIYSVESLDLSAETELIRNASWLSPEKLQSVEAYRIKYSVNNLKVVGYIVIPASEEKLPCLIHLRGGSREVGAIDTRAVVNHMVRYAIEGYIVIATQYPGVEGGGGRDAFGSEDDMASIVQLKKILESLSVADTERIGVKGSSRGGLMAYMLLKEVEWIKAAAVISAPTDQFSQAEEREGWREHQHAMWGDSPAETERRSPLKWADELPKDAPLLIMHGAADCRVDAGQSLRVAEKLYELQVPFRFLLFEGTDHSISEHRKECTDQTLEWFKRFLQQSEPLPNTEPHGD